MIKLLSVEALISSLGRRRKIKKLLYREGKGDKGSILALEIERATLVSPFYEVFRSWKTYFTHRYGPHVCTSHIGTFVRNVLKVALVYAGHCGFRDLPSNI